MLMGTLKKISYYRTIADGNEIEKANTLCKVCVKLFVALNFMK